MPITTLKQVSRSSIVLRSASLSHCRFTTSSKFRSRLRQPGEPSGPNEPPAHTSSPPSKSPLKVWPFVFIFAAGSFGFKKIVDQRKGEYKAPGPVAGHSPSRP
ncbi:unnamed protein product [Periconia digitata]|uniref:Uncharacterized protein n=1 Tax=Periconia digitata TaxID=1303443 RepID=A0A9W4UTT4_9PLEO|nr:unnamed protein product [Periconia digitata]